MRRLTKLELKEFDWTYKFLDNYVGGMSHLVDRPGLIRIKLKEEKDFVQLPQAVFKFVEDIGKLKEVPELNIKFGYALTPIQKVNILFNETTKRHKDIVMQKLINYCFKNKVQPHQLRYRDIEDVQIIEPELIPVVMTEFNG